MEQGTDLTWLESGGGPLVVVPISALAAWHGVSDDFDPDDLDTWGDYGRACEIADRAGVVRIGPVEGLVLGGEPGSTTYLPEERLFVRWIRGDSSGDLRRLVSDVARGADWEDAGTWVTDGPAVLFDSALAGDEAEPTERLDVEVDSGGYLVRTAYVEPDAATALVLVRLATA